MSAKAYFARAIETLQQVAATQTTAIDAAADLVVDAVVDGKALYAFGATHSFMVAEELVYRTGGLMLWNPICPHGMNLSVRPMPATTTRTAGDARQAAPSAVRSASTATMTSMRFMWMRQACEGARRRFASSASATGRCSPLARSLSMARPSASSAPRITAKRARCFDASASSLPTLRVAL